MNGLPYLILAAALVLASCAAMPAMQPFAPATVANATLIDERTALAVEVAYKIAGLAIEAAVDSGRITGDTARRVDAIDAQAARYVGLARAAYDAGNARGYVQAAAQAAPLIAELRAIGGAK